MKNIMYYIGFAPAHVLGHQVMYYMHGWVM